ncbi:MAG TPA: hypothetical protein VLV87_03285 [Gammaproteobacteria bacterium]|nr:hypothetical protein [Gammaproteobacteria bacterium]
MSAKPANKTAGTRRPRKPEARKTKTPQEISQELREQRALDPAQSEVEGYLKPPFEHFRS